jgi:hypothetical protein
MRGVVEQRGDKRWRVRVFVGREGGRTRWVSQTITGTKRQAQVALAKLVTEVETGQVAKSHAGSVADLLDRWLDDIALTRTAYTMREHRRSVERDIKPAIGPGHQHRRNARRLPVPPSRRAAQHASQVGPALVDDPYLLSRSADGSVPCLPDGLTAGYARLARGLGIPGHFHELRHFAAIVSARAPMCGR